MGVVEDVNYFWFERQPRATVHLSSEQAPRRWINVVVRTAGPLTAMASAVRSTIIQLDPDQGGGRYALNGRSHRGPLGWRSGCDISNGLIWTQIRNHGCSRGFIV